MNYLEQCVESVQSIDPAELGVMPVGEAVSRLGTSYFTYTLGRFVIAGEATHVGLKIPMAKGMPASINRRVLSDVALVTYLTDKVPALLPMVPKFLGVLAVEDTDAVAVITEDASAGNEHKVEYTTVLPYKVELALFRAFAWAGRRKEVFNYKALRGSMAFAVNGGVRILDFTPPPFQTGFQSWPEYHEVHGATTDQMDALTVTVGSGSPLAQSILAM